MIVQLTPQQQMALTFRGYADKEVEVVPVGDQFHAWVVKDGDLGPEWIEVLARSPEIAVNQLAQLAVRP